MSELLRSGLSKRERQIMEAVLSRKRATALVRGMAVFLAALAVTGLVRRLCTETRHLIWLGAIASFLLIPLAWLLLPPIRIGAVISLEPAAPLKLAAAPALSAGEYGRLAGGSILPGRAPGSRETQAPTAGGGGGRG
jgi:hypothetical protein